MVCLTICLFGCFVSGLLGCLAVCSGWSGWPGWCVLTGLIWIGLVQSGLVRSVGWLVLLCALYFFFLLYCDCFFFPFAWF